MKRGLSLSDITSVMFNDNENTNEDAFTQVRGDAESLKGWCSTKTNILLAIAYDRQRYIQCYFTMQSSITI